MKPSKLTCLAIALLLVVTMVATILSTCCIDNKIMC